MILNVINYYRDALHPFASTISLLLFMVISFAIRIRRLKWKLQAMQREIDELKARSMSHLA